jgi:hypothetical protein
MVLEPEHVHTGKRRVQHMIKKQDEFVEGVLESN